MKTTNNNLRITWARRQEIKDIARESLKKYNITTPPANPKKILMGIGELYGFDDPEEKGFTLYKDGKYSIYINTVEYKFMVAWTSAHELAHIELDHFHLGYGYLTSEFDCRLLDAEADIFAAEFLMQEDWIREYTQWFPPSEAKNLGKLKDLFKVSWDSLLNRLENLKVQSKNTSVKILAFNSNKNDESLYSEFMGEFINKQDKSDLAPKDNKIPIISKEHSVSNNKSATSKTKSKDIIISDSREYIARDSFDILKRYDDELNIRNMNVLHSLEEAYLNPDHVSPRFDVYEEWIGYDEKDFW